MCAMPSSASIKPMLGTCKVRALSAILLLPTPKVFYKNISDLTHIPLDMHVVHLYYQTVGKEALLYKEMETVIFPL